MANTTRKTVSYTHLDVYKRQEVSTVNATALPADAPEGALPSEVRPEIVTWEKLCEAIKASGKAVSYTHLQRAGGFYL